MAQVQTGSVASGRLKQPTFLATARSRRSATPALPDAAAASSQPPAQPQVRAPLPTPTIRHPGPRTPIGSPCIPHSLSVHCLCKPCNPDSNARHPARPASPPTPVAPPAARAPRPAIRAQSHVAVSPRPAQGIAQTPVQPPLPRPTPPAIRRQRPPRPRQSAERQPRIPSLRWPTFPGPRQAPNPAKTHPAPPQEFFGKNSYCARGSRFTSLQQPQRPFTLPRPIRRSHAPCPGDPPPPPRRSHGPTRPAAGPSHGAVVPGLGSSEIRQKIRPNRLSPARPLWGRAGERRFPPSPPRRSGPHPPAAPCTLTSRSTVTPESRS